MADHGTRRRRQALADISNMETNKRQNQSTETTVSAFKRLQEELMDLVMNGEYGISAFPTEDNIFSWTGTITGRKETVFEGKEYKLSIFFPQDYPFKPPEVTFNTNVGVFALVILQDKWSCVYGVRTILLSIQSLLAGSPLNTQAAEIWSNQEACRKMVGKLYKSSPLQKM